MMVVAKKAKKTEIVNSSEYEHTFICHVKVGETFGGVYYLVSCYEKLAVNGKIYSDLTVRDKSGEGFVRLWGESKQLKVGSFVVIFANVEEYRGKLQIVAQKVEVEENPSPEDMLKYYIPVSLSKDEDIDKFKKYILRVDELCKQAESNTCRMILGGVFTPEFCDRFFSAPASDSPYYGVNGGLLAHTMKTAFGVGSLASQYGLKPLEIAIAVTSALLHRIGAVEAFNIETCHADETDCGKLHGSKYYTMGLLNSVIGGLELNEEQANKDVVDRIIHCLVSQDYKDVKPMTKEAIILSEVVRADVRIVSAIDFIEQDKNDDKFTAFDAKNRQQYFKT